MVKFEVALTEADIKNFVKHKMNLKDKKTILPFLAHFFSAIIILVANFFYDFGIVGWLVAAVFMSFFGFNMYKIYNTYKKILIKNLDIVNKNRKFFVDQHLLSILCDSNSDFCGRYPMYDLKNCTKLQEYYYLTFNPKSYIIIPRKFLDNSQDTELSNIFKCN